MVRCYKKKTDRQPNTPRKLKKALGLVENGYSLRVAASECNVNYGCLFRLQKKMKKANSRSTEEDSTLILSHKLPVFTKEQEDSIASYCIDIALSGYGLTTVKVRELAYEIAATNNLKFPNTWRESKKAGVDWLQSFQKRHPNLSIRTPEACSIARAEAFNKHNVDTFFEKLSNVLGRHPNFANGSRVVNLDETSTSTVQNMRKILSPKGVKQVHKIKSAERGVSVTTCCVVSAYGCVYPPVLIFPRKRFVNHMLNNAFPGTLGLANENGYMTKDAFYHVLLHVIKCTSASKDNPLLLLMDNVDTHFSAQILQLAKDNGVTVLTFPPHCTHKLQPLDLSFFGPFKAYYDSAVSDWITRNPGRPATIYEIAGFVKIALGRASNVATISSGFAKAGIYPFDRNVFNDSDFVMAKVTERPDPTGESVVAVNNVPDSEPTQSEPSQNILDGSPEENPAATLDVPGSSATFIGPMLLKGLPKANLAATQQRKPRRKGKCRVATDTPEKNQIEALEKEAQDKKKKTMENKKTRERKNLLKEIGLEEPQQQTKGKTASKRLVQHTTVKQGSKRLRQAQAQKSKKRLVFTSDEESDDSFTVDGDLGEPVVNVISSKDLPALERSPEEGDYVLVLFQSRDSKCYVGKIISDKDEDGDYEISYLRQTDLKFVLPNVPDLCSVSVSDIKAILPKPSCQQGLTRRQQSHLSFEFNFDSFKMA